MGHSAQNCSQFLCAIPGLYRSLADDSLQRYPLKGWKTKIRWRSENNSVRCCHIHSHQYYYSHTKCCSFWNSGSNSKLCDCCSTKFYGTACFLLASTILSSSFQETQVCFLRFPCCTRDTVSNDNLTEYFDHFGYQVIQYLLRLLSLLRS